MIKEIYCYHDVIHGFYNIGVYKNEMDAVRVFKWTMNRDNLPEFVQNDLSLMRIGTFDDESGDLFACEPKEVYKGADFVE